MELFLSNFPERNSFFSNLKLNNLFLKENHNGVVFLLNGFLDSSLLLVEFLSLIFHKLFSFSISLFKFKSFNLTLSTKSFK